jgi:hypothetical protein
MSAHFKTVDREAICPSRDHCLESILIVKIMLGATFERSIILSRKEFSGSFSGFCRFPSSPSEKEDFGWQPACDSRGEAV